MKRGYNNKFINAMNNSVDALERDNADTAILQAPTAPLARSPRAEATVNLKFRTLYFTLNGGVYTPIAAAALNAALQSDLPFFIFGNNDFPAGYKKLKGEFVINSNWTYGRPGVFGKDDFSELAFDANVTGLLETGDMVIPFTSALPGTGTTTLAINIVRASEVAYGSLLSMIASDRFQISGLRYVLDDATQIAQYSRQISFGYLSIFGRYSSDKMTPNDHKDSDQFQNGIIEIPIDGKWGQTDKHLAWGFFNLYTNVSQNWTLFVNQVNKLSA